MQKTILVALSLVLLAGALRFAKLGEWSFDRDEVFTLVETKAFFGEIEIPKKYLSKHSTDPADSPLTRLPKMVPLAYLTHYLDYRLFGEDQFGARVLMAVIGSLGIGIVWLLGKPLLGSVRASTLAFFMMLWPAHLFFSQENRFYIEAFVLTTIVFLLAGHVVKRSSFFATFFLGLAGLGMIFCHTLTGIIWGFVLIGITASFFLEKCLPPTHVALPLLTFSFVFLAIAFFYLIPLGQGWNSGGHWGYTSLHAMLAMVNLLGWPVALFAFLGGIHTAINFRTNNDIFWLVTAACCVFAVLILPKLIVFSPAYLFLFSFPSLLLAVNFVEITYGNIVARQRLSFRFLGTLWLASFCLFNLPSLASYYIDGNRCNNRDAFYYVREHWREGDRLTGYLMGAAEWYIPECKPTIPLRTEQTVEKLRELAQEESRLWIVVQSHRGGLEDDVRRWLGQNCSYEYRAGKKRFDYAENTVEVFLHPPVRNFYCEDGKK